MTVATEEAKAKLTWSLHVVGQRDGLHLLEAEMVTLDLCDRLEFTETHAASRVELVVESPADRVGERGADTIVRRALQVVGRTSHVTINKRIPFGAGLGGGSADAAAVLRWAGHDELGDALMLGSDVPFCLSGGHAMVRGMGERLEQLAPLRATVTLAVLPFGVDTADCYRAYDALDAGQHHERNDLTAAAETIAPAIRDVRAILEARCGRPFHLAGSGSTLFCEGDPLGLGPRSDPVGVTTEVGEVRLLVAQTD